MYRKKEIYQSSDVKHESQTKVNSIGDLFRDYGEAYINTYKPHHEIIRLIKNIRVCKTEKLGGHIITCKDCGHKHYIYKSCGHSQCMICQSIKREQWKDRLKQKLLKVPYVHMVFTLPHQLNGLTKQNEKTIYSLLIKSCWLTVKEIYKSKGEPGMTSVLHTFGSDLKYHIHVHALVTFGCLNKEGKWIYPDHKFKIEGYRKISATFKNKFIEQLGKARPSLTYHTPINNLIEEVSKVRWVVHNTRPSTNTQVIQSYLARYINRIAVTNNRLQYLKETEEVKLLYNDYKHQQEGRPAPKEIKILHPLSAIHHIVQHVLPKHFQKSRSYGLHQKLNKYHQMLPEALKNNGATIRTIIEIINQLIKEKPFECAECKSSNYTIEDLDPIRTDMKKMKRGIKRNKSPTKIKDTAKITMMAKKSKATAMPQANKNISTIAS